MEIQLRVVLLSIGLLILLVVALDLWKRKSIQDTYDDEILDHNKVRTPELPLIERDQDPEVNLYVANVAAQQDLHVPPEVTADFTENMAENLAEFFPAPKIVTISIMARNEDGFPGKKLIEVLESAKLEYGKNDVFHRMVGDEILFSAVNAVEPGYFIYVTLPEESVSGITLILLPERVVDPEYVFDTFLRAAKQIAFALSGELLDHERRPLTLDKIEQYRKEMRVVARAS